MFPGGGADLANYFYARCNAELRQQLKAKSEEGVPKVSVFVRDAVEQRIRMTLPYRDTWPQAMAELGSPSGAKVMLRIVLFLDQQLNPKTAMFTSKGSFRSRKKIVKISFPGVAVWESCSVKTVSV